MRMNIFSGIPRTARIQVPGIVGDLIHRTLCTEEAEGSRSEAERAAMSMVASAGRIFSKNEGFRGLLGFRGVYFWGMKGIRKV